MKDVNLEKLFHISLVALLKTSSNAFLLEVSFLDLVS